MNSLCLEDQLCFKLYAISRQMTGIYRPVLDQLDITYPQYLVMMVLWEEQDISVKLIGERLYLDSGTLTPLLKRLEQKGLLTRRRSASDERSVLIGLTAAGMALKEKAAEVPAALQQCISLEQQNYASLKLQLDQLLNQLIQS